jgi:hypothetical protein
MIQNAILVLDDFPFGRKGRDGLCFLFQIVSMAGRGFTVWILSSIVLNFILFPNLVMTVGTALSESPDGLPENNMATFYPEFESGNRSAGNSQMSVFHGI